MRTLFVTAAVLTAGLLSIQATPVKVVEKTLVISLKAYAAGEESVRGDTLSQGVAVFRITSRDVIQNIAQDNDLSFPAASQLVVRETYGSEGIQDHRILIRARGFDDYDATRYFGWGTYGLVTRSTVSLSRGTGAFAYYSSEWVGMDLGEFGVLDLTGFVMETGRTVLAPAVPEPIRLDVSNFRAKVVGELYNADEEPIAVIDGKINSAGAKILK